MSLFCLMTLGSDGRVEGLAVSFAVRCPPVGVVLLCFFEHVCPCGHRVGFTLALLGRLSNLVVPTNYLQWLFAWQRCAVLSLCITASCAVSS